MKKMFTLFLLIGTLIACSSDDDSGSNDTVTSLELTLEDTNGNPVSGIVVYAYDQNTWSVIGDNPQFADFQASSDSNGVATFSNLTTDLNFTELNNFTQTFRFSAYYTINGNNTNKVTAISFNRGDDKTQTITLD